MEGGKRTDNRYSTFLGDFAVETLIRYFALEKKILALTMHTSRASIVQSTNLCQVPD